MSDEPQEQKKEEPKSQVFNLKPSETQTLVILQSSHQRSFAALLSLVASERMGYQVTDRTQFRLNEDLSTMEISELPEDVPVATASPENDPQVTEDEEPKSGAVAAK